MGMKKVIGGQHGYRIPFFIGGNDNDYTPAKPAPIAQNCKNCAAPLNWNLEACEYCDTFFVQKSAYVPTVARQYQVKPGEIPTTTYGFPGVYYDPRAIDPKDLGKSLIPIKPSFWTSLIHGGAQVAMMMLPRRQ